MHKHDQEIIMALAEGTLAGDAAAVARAEISGCVECSEDLELQQLALSVLNETPEVYLSASESATLHRELKRELVGIKPLATAPASRFAWGRWASIAAGTAAVFLVGAMVLPGVMGGSDDDSSATTVAASIGTDSADEEMAGLDRSTVAATEAVPNTELSLQDGGAGDFAESGAETTAAPAADTATTAAPTETTTSADTTWVDLLPLLGFGDLTEEIRQEFIDSLLTDDNGVRLLDESVKSTTPRIGTCFAQLAVDLGVPDGSEAITVGNLAGTDGAERLVVAYVPDDVTQTVIVATSYPDCEAFQVIFP